MTRFSCAPVLVAEEATPRLCSEEPRQLTRQATFPRARQNDQRLADSDVTRFSCALVLMAEEGTPRLCLEEPRQLTRQATLLPA